MTAIRCCSVTVIKGTARAYLPYPTEHCRHAGDHARSILPPNRRWREEFLSRQSRSARENLSANSAAVRSGSSKNPPVPPPKAISRSTNTLILPVKGAPQCAQAGARATPAFKIAAILLADAAEGIGRVRVLLDHRFRARRCGHVVVGHGKALARLGIRRKMIPGGIGRAAHARCCWPCSRAANAASRAFPT